MATHIYHVIASWSHADVYLAQTLARFLRADHQLVVAMYQALSGGEARRAALDTAAKMALSSDDYNLFQAIWATTKASRDRRNDFSHHVWAESVDLPDSLLLAAPDVLSGGLLPLTVSAPNIQQKTETELDRSRIYVYREKDLKEDVDGANYAADLIIAMWEAFGPPSPQRDAKRTWLLNQPEIQRRLAKLSQTEDREPPP